MGKEGPKYIVIVKYIVTYYKLDILILCHIGKYSIEKPCFQFSSMTRSIIKVGSFPNVFKLLSKMTTFITFFPSALLFL